MDPSDSSAAKTALRDQLLTARRRRPLWQVREDAQAIAEHLLAAVPVRRAASVAAYVSIAEEPGTGPLLDGLVALGKRVILPIVLPDRDLDWAEYDGPESLRAARMGLLEPQGRSLGVDAIGTPDAVLTPGLAVAADGMRLGRGGGCYDRALGRVPIGTFTCTLLYSEEYPVDVPRDAHDRPVTAVATPVGISRCGTGRA